MQLERPRVQRYIAVVALSAAIVLAMQVRRHRVDSTPPTAATSAFRPAPATCRIDSDNASYEVCVVDEAGNPLADVDVYLAHQYFFEQGDIHDLVGHVRSDATGLARFSLPASPYGGELYAVGQRAGWPPALIENHRLVLGPPRTITGRVELTPCAKPETRVAAASEYWWPAEGLPEPQDVVVDAKPDGTFALEGLGAGQYHISALACSGKSSQFLFTDVRGADLAGRELRLHLLHDPH